MIAGPDPVGNAIAASAALYAEAPLVITAPEDDLGAGLLASSAAVALGVPLLLTPTTDAPARVVPLEAELRRLECTHVLSIGGAANAVAGPNGDRELLHVAATARALAAILPGKPKVTRVSAAGAVAAVAALDPRSPVLLSLAPGPTEAPVPAGPAPPSRPPCRRARRSRACGGRLCPPCGLVIAVNDPAGLLGMATARAAGAEVLVLPADASNPQASSAAIEFLAEHPDDPVVALGAQLGAERSLDWKIASARTGLQLPGGGQLLFPRHLMVAIYGTPGAPVLGVLGEQDLGASIDRAHRHAAAYEKLTGKQVLPAFELIATVASGGKGSDKNYSNELSPSRMLEWAKAAGEAGMYAILDLQPGRTDFVTQAKLYEKVLRLPWVGLALDPEWRLKPRERHLVHIGSVGSAEVNAVQDYLTELVRANDLPPKLLVLHQFRTDMVEDRAGVDVDRPEVAVLIHADGQGSQPEKRATWKRLRADAPDVAWGWKNFYDEDAPMLTPEQTMMVEPVPDLITYQ